jgi:hypothetical protein
MPIATVSKRLAAFALLVFLSACATGPKVETEVIEQPDGVIVVDTLRLEATVTAIDATTREIRLKPAYGDEETFTAGEEMVNFGQVRVGDTVRAVVVESMAINLVPGGAPEGVDAAEAVVLAPKGEKPGGVTVDAVEVTGTIVAIDGHDHTVTVRFPTGATDVLQVGKHRDLSQVALGDSIRFRMTEAFAISVETTPR